MDSTAIVDQRHDGPQSKFPFLSKCLSYRLSVALSAAALLTHISPSITSPCQYHLMIFVITKLYAIFHANVTAEVSQKHWQELMSLPSY